MSVSAKLRETAPLPPCLGADETAGSPAGPYENCAGRMAFGAPTFPLTRGDAAPAPPETGVSGASVGVTACVQPASAVRAASAAGKYRFNLQHLVRPVPNCF